MKKRVASAVELAKLLGVSSATVSRAFVPSSPMRPETRGRVLAMAREYNYHPNAIARSLNNRQSQLVGLVVNEIDQSMIAEMVQKLAVELQKLELLPILLCCADHNDRLQLMRLASAHQLRSVVLFSDMITREDAIDIFHDAQLIMLSSEPGIEGKASEIRSNGAAGAGRIIDKVVADGHRSFAYLTGRQSSWMDKARIDWFRAALKRHGLDIKAVRQGDFTYESGFKETMMLLHQGGFDAIIGGNDVMAIGARDAAVKAFSRRVPEDIAIIGQDGIDMAAWESHDLTTLAIDKAGAIEAAIKIILAGSEPDAPAVSVPLECTVRWGSTA